MAWTDLPSIRMKPPSLFLSGLSRRRMGRGQDTARDRTRLHGCPGLSSLTNRPLRDRSPLLMALSPWYQAAILFLSFCAKSLQCAMMVQRDRRSVLLVNRELTQRLRLWADNTLSVQKNQLHLCSFIWQKAQQNKVGSHYWLWFSMVLYVDVIWGKCLSNVKSCFCDYKQMYKIRIKYGLWLWKALLYRTDFFDRKKKSKGCKKRILKAPR